MKIVKLISENIKKIKAIMIEPSGSTVVIGSRKNGEGKSSALDSILYALGGTRGICDEPLRHGAKKGKIICDLGDIIVKRTFTKSGNTALIVRNNDGTQVASPQQLLDKLTGKIGLDPLEFSRMEQVKQVEVFKELLNLDFTILDADEKMYRADRALVNKDVKNFKALTSIPLPKDGPTSRVSMSTLTDELQKATKFNEMIRRSKRDLLNITEEADTNADTINKLTFKLNELQMRQEAIEKEVGKLHKFIDEAKLVNEAKIMGRMNDIEKINEEVTERENFIRNKESYKKAKIKSDMYTDKITAIDKKRKQQLDDADVPVEGLTFDEAGIFYNNVPFKQLGSGEQLRISVAMGLAMNPELKVLLIRDGSLLDKDNLQMIADMAEEHDAQVWIERVSEGEECTLIIEDGMEKVSDQEQEKLF